MKRITLFVALLFTIFLLGCTSDLPPEPGAIGPPIGEAIAILKGYGPPDDIFNGQQIFFLDNNIFNLPPEQETLDLEASVKYEEGYVYKYGYYYSDSEWQKYEFPKETVGKSNWIKGSASTSLTLDTAGMTIDEDNYIVTYSCKKYDGEWKCGCSDDGSCNQWMLQSYFYSVILPPEPEPISEIKEEYYGPSYDVFNGQQIFFLDKNIFNLPPEQETLELGVNVKHEGGYVYKYGYVYNKDDGWIMYEFQQETVGKSNWIKDSASTSLKLNTASIAVDEKNPLLAYSCKKYGGEWKCGCSSKESPCNQWMRETYLYTLILPSEPTALAIDVNCEEEYGKEYKCRSYDFWELECNKKGDIKEIEGICNSDGDNYCVTCES